MNKRFGSVTIFSSVQWLFFIFANTVMIPISVGTVFQLPDETIAMMLRASLVFTGLASIFQGWKGHRYPLMEGHSGLLWGVILNLGLSASSLGMSYTEIGGGIATGVLLASAVTLILAAFNGISLLKTIFNPMVMSVYLFLLTFQLIFIFFKGMMKVSEQGTMDVPVTLYSFALVIFVSLLKLKGNGIVSNFSILIGLLAGWIGYDLLFMSEVQQDAAAGDVSFTLFPLGPPNLEIGIIAVTFFAGLMNLSNTVASISSGDTLFKKESGHREYRGSIFFTAVFTVIGSGFGLVPYTPFTSSIGFLQSTRIFMKTPFFLGGALLAVIGLIPPLGTWLAGMPVTVGNAVLFVAYLQLFGTAFNSLNGKVFNSNTIFRLAAPVLIGISLMNTPAALFADLPVLIQPFISNGLIMGVFISILMEKMVNWSVFESFELKNN
ncbi:uracil/xanthine transporter [Bacillus sp. ISL-47]|uniref:uracil/xanthine transporter n=1 Tax=Bacillus sp. ISL-47 TaxID=2819130 RepID=UPI001BEBC801|nr:uracil/xanthine transporter [Bacillus sp. ISL-47]MBT2690162.1 uracil/xanthine transporter [Bacillus sp. ISL-47]MBT2710389.1 uracil/xanthine transporter [Pseudomonas sp. ISL-84]